MTSTEKQVSGNGGEAPEVMTVEKARQLLLTSLNLKVGEKDPALIPVVLHKALLEDYERLLERHVAASAEAMTLAASSVVKTVRQAADGLRDETLKSSVRQSLAEAAEYARQIESLKSDLQRTVARQIAVHGILTVVTFIAAAATILALMKV